MLIFFDAEDLPLILTVNGKIIAGRLISQQHYHKGLKKIFGAREDFPLELEHLAEPPELIYLKDTRSVAPDSITFPTDNSGFLWRGKLSAVDNLAAGYRKLMLLIWPVTSRYSIIPRSANGAGTP